MPVSRDSWTGWKVAEDTLFWALSTVRTLPMLCFFLVSNMCSGVSSGEFTSFLLNARRISLCIRFRIYGPSAQSVLHDWSTLQNLTKITRTIDLSTQQGVCLFLHEWRSELRVSGQDKEHRQYRNNIVLSLHDIQQCLLWMNMDEAVLCFIKHT